MSEKFKKLQSDIERIKHIRFIASRRLTMYNNWFNISLAVLSLGLIIASLSNLLPIEINQKQKDWLSYIQIVLAIIVLSYSLLVANYNFAVRSVMFHQCGIELSTLARHLQSGTQTQPEYINMIEKYSEILKRYENHKHVDFLGFQLQKYNENRPKTKCILAKSKRKMSICFFLKIQYIFDLRIIYIRLERFLHIFFGIFPHAALIMLEFGSLYYVYAM